MSGNKKPNKLIHSSSPYLLQHAYNPVRWMPWSQEALNKAVREDKPIIVSIGYSSCHWCHVMEKESFENEEISQIMNEHFISIKVDREERPDVDQIYMEAVQAMGMQGGWPLNVFLTPRQKPFYGGTYFPLQSWKNLLLKIAEVFKSKRDEINESSDRFTEAISFSDLKKYGISRKESEFSEEDADKMYSSIAERFDKVEGGLQGAPKFPMPSIWSFLLNYYHLSGMKEALEQVNLTLEKIGMGGIYDQIGGGFARYSVDSKWFVPHFEKMLYDNAQMISLYSQAYQVTGNELFKEIVYDTIRWAEWDMIDKTGGFYSALDADSGGEEGKYYVWELKEIQKILKEDADWFCSLFNVTQKGNWENGKNILHLGKGYKKFATDTGIQLNELKNKISASKEKLLDKRNKREKPGLDDKILAGWNGLMLKALADAYSVFNDKKFLNLALKNASFIEKELITDHQLKRNYKDGKAGIDGFLEDYAAVVSGMIELYQATFEEKWIRVAQNLTNYVMENFFDEEEGFFYFTDLNSENLIARKKEILDNVIPASNSMMARNLFMLGTIYDNEDYKKISKSMLSSMMELMIKEPGYTSNWGILLTYLVQPFHEIIIVGEEWETQKERLTNRFIPNKIIAGTKEKSELPLLQNRESKEGKTTIYVCHNKTCKLPVHKVEKAFEQMNAK